MTFNLDNFLAPLDIWVVLMALVLGMVVGFRMRQLGPPMSRSRVFWQIADGFVFFVPLAALRAFEGSLVWERFLATLPLWIIYIAGMRLGNSFEWDRLPGNGHRNDAPREGRQQGEQPRVEIDQPRRRTALAPITQYGPNTPGTGTHLHAVPSPVRPQRRP